MYFFQILTALHLISKLCYASFVKTLDLRDVESGSSLRAGLRASSQTAHNQGSRAMVPEISSTGSGETRTQRESGARHPGSGHPNVAIDHDNMNGWNSQQLPYVNYRPVPVYPPGLSSHGPLDPFYYSFPSNYGPPVHVYSPILSSHGPLVYSPFLSNHPPVYQLIPSNHGPLVYSPVLSNHPPVYQPIHFNHGTISFLYPLPPPSLSHGAFTAFSVPRPLLSNSAVLGLPAHGSYFSYNPGFTTHLWEAGHEEHESQVFYSPSQTSTSWNQAASYPPGHYSTQDHPHLIVATTSVPPNQIDIANPPPKQNEQVVSESSQPKRELEGTSVKSQDKENSAKAPLLSSLGSGKEILEESSLQSPDSDHTSSIAPTEVGISKQIADKDSLGAEVERPTNIQQNQVSERDTESAKVNTPTNELPGSTRVHVADVKVKSKPHQIDTEKEGQEAQVTTENPHGDELKADLNPSKGVNAQANRKATRKLEKLKKKNASRNGPPRNSKKTAVREGTGLSPPHDGEESTSSSAKAEAKMPDQEVAITDKQDSDQKTSKEEKNSKDEGEGEQKLKENTGASELERLPEASVEGNLADKVDDINTSQSSSLSKDPATEAQSKTGNPSKKNQKKRLKKKEKLAGDILPSLEGPPRREPLPKTVGSNSDQEPQEAKRPEVILKEILQPENKKHFLEVELDEATFASIGKSDIISAMHQAKFFDEKEGLRRFHSIIAQWHQKRLLHYCDASAKISQWFTIFKV
ncbi:hypothetical protein CROQUDRAFT_719087 [Cronartium quercuum f. sp. fusiforme G11]|uniref:Uncharacterized protein n=1 Tax=Cronartium quercuum f. sp. fusiforme G11 TaxID=708437 RepID=A0A9P6N8E6_9BASI|nr:hypothetical protein CROQUDRAFT_719087 [Cronartium quercuum f. sp. fusiforme G11]